jgi:N-acetylglucosamine malate deacetylase 1
MRDHSKTLTATLKDQPRSRKDNVPKDANGAYKYLTNFARKSRGVFRYPKFEPLDISGNPRVLVLAPHPDDDVIGCGGTIARCIEQGSHVKVVCLTDGRHGNSRIQMAELIEQRRRETRSALQKVGGNDVTFLDNPDMKLKCNRENVDAILRIVREFRPTAIFLPSFWEIPPDHLMTAHIAANVAKMVRRDIDWYCYEVWCPIAFLPNTQIVIVDVTSVIQRKIAAIGEHKSQTEIVDYAPKIAGLNAYRSMMASKGVEYCEAFMKFSRQEFIEYAKGLGVYENKV